MRGTGGTACSWRVSEVKPPTPSMSDRVSGSEHLDLGARHDLEYGSSWTLDYALDSIGESI